MLVKLMGPTSELIAEISLKTGAKPGSTRAVVLTSNLTSAVVGLAMATCLILGVGGLGGGPLLPWNASTIKSLTMTSPPVFQKMMAAST